MNKIKKVLCFVLSIAMVFVFTSCANDTENGNSEVDIEETTTSANDIKSTIPAEEISAESANEKLHIGIVIPGTRADSSKNDINSMIMSTSVKDVIAESNYLEEKCFSFAENVKPTDKNALINAVDKLVEQHSSIIVFADSGYGKFVEKIASDNTTIMFIVNDYENKNEEIRNICSYSANITGAEYLCGIVSAYKTKELKANKIGYLLTENLDLSILNAFAEGVKSVDKNLKISAVVSKNPKSDAQVLVSSGCKVLASNFFSRDIQEIANKNKIYFCGFGTENYPSQEYMLCSAIYDYRQLFINAVGYYRHNSDITDFIGGYAAKTTYISAINSKIIAQGTNEAIGRVNHNLLNSELDTRLSKTKPISNISLSGSVKVTQPETTTEAQ
ncbi:MAG: hypothetical protein KBT46_07740 [Ruminococcus sp.]|nr:hypothetical protein [Candidatus Copronaster equi]